MRVTLKEIARHAGVSVATVDRVVNKRSGVHARTAGQVMRVMQKLGAITDPVAARPRERPVTFDIVLPQGTNTFINMLEAELAAAAASWPEGRVDARVRRIPGFDPIALSAALTAAASAADGVAFVAIDHPAVREAMTGLERSGVPAVTLLSDLPGTGRRSYVGIDNRAAGRTAGYLMGRFLRASRGKVALLAGSLSYRGHEEREMGFRHIFREDFRQYEIIGVSEVQDDVAKSQARVDELLRSHADLVGIYSIGGGNRGVAQALIAHGRTQDVVFVGHELTEHSRRFLVDGVMDAAINQDAAAEARQAIRLLRDAAVGEHDAAPASPIRIEVFLRENLP
ncbi:MAG: LacI family DNA-binding transcriptional regulator [Alphaproteobacteria bacterium]